jgi:hypothetical protein
MALPEEPRQLGSMLTIRGSEFDCDQFEPSVDRTDTEL